MARLVSTIDAAIVDDVLQKAAQGFGSLAELGAVTTRSVEISAGGTTGTAVVTASGVPEGRGKTTNVNLSFFEVEFGGGVVRLTDFQLGSNVLFPILADDGFPAVLGLIFTDADRVLGGASDDLLRGLGGNDTLLGRAGDDQIIASAGNDVLNGALGDDTLLGGGGNDRILSGGGADRAVGGGGSDTILGGGGDDQILGGGGADTLRAGGGNDEVFGGGLADFIAAGGGADTVNGGAGADTILGGAGADVFVFTSLAGRDEIRGFASGQDRIDLSSISAISSFDDLQRGGLTDTADGVVISAGARDVAILTGVSASDLSETDFIF
ncbi:MAG: calcium-binding protein [Pseudomonadota bacterium]